MAENAKPSAEIDGHTGEVVLINVFDVAPENADALATQLAAATESVISKEPGFISATFHVSLNKRHVANRSIWRSKADFLALLKSERAADAVQPAMQLATSFRPALYKVEHTILAPGNEG